MLCVSTNGDFFELAAYTDDIVNQDGMQLFDRRKTFLTSSLEKICAAPFEREKMFTLPSISAFEISV